MSRGPTTIKIISGSLSALVKHHESLHFGMRVNNFWLAAKPVPAGPISASSWYLPAV